jgi:soluble lytic murein transglycosylase
MEFKQFLCTRAGGPVVCWPFLIPACWWPNLTMTRRTSKKLSRFGNWLAAGLVLAVVTALAVVHVRWVYREQRWNQLIEQIAPRYGVDKFLIKAVMRQESGFDAFAYSRTGAIGLMQIMPATGGDWARAVGRRDFATSALWTPQLNIEAGAWYLARGLNYWRGQGVDDPLPFALAEYNAGRGNVQRWRAPTAAAFRAQITHPGVRHYVARVLDYHAHYQARGRL